MITPGVNKLIFLLEDVMDKIVNRRSEYEGVPNFEDSYKLYLGVDGEDGTEYTEVDPSDELDLPDSSFDMLAFIDNLIHLEKGWGFSITYDPLASSWHFIYKSDNPEHSFAVQSSDLTEVLRSGLRAMTDIESDIENKKEFLEFCDDQFSRKQGDLNG